GLDGVSFLPALLGKPQRAHEYLYWEFHERGFSQAVRIGDWKAVRRASQKNPIELYHLKTDLGEQDDVAAQYPHIVERAAELFKSARADSPEFPIRETTLAKTQR
ncbi:MAG: arylsulfatase, partial [Acidobacteria bacterium]|nr:arylsulfatase [Acidobacteriota bacterium]